MSDYVSMMAVPSECQSITRSLASIQNIASQIQSFGQWVRQRRKQHQLTQKALGRLIGYAEITIRQIEHDKYRLTRFVVDSLVNCLAVEREDREAVVRFALGQLSSAQLLDRSSGTPMRTTPFFGRTAELATIRSLLSNPDCRCISVVGLGGIGKTRLVRQTMDDVFRETSSTVWFVNLASISTADLLPTVVGEALNIALTPFESPLERLLLSIRSREALLVLDNFEQLLPDGIGFVLAILKHAPHVKIMITSRERLRLSAEWCVKVHGLDTSYQPAMSDAMQLFLNTAQRMNREFAPTDIHAIHDICRVVQGIPLAIEMAASWTEVYSCHEILLGISTNVFDLAARQHDVDERHRTLQAVFEPTWMLLSPLDQGALKKLAAFRDGFTLDVANCVAGIAPTSLAVLQDKMLLEPQTNGRFMIHEIVRQFALQKLMVYESELL